MEKRVLIACGTAIATSTMVAYKVEELGKEIGVPVRAIQCKAAEIRSKVDSVKPVLIVATTQVPDLGIPVFNGVPFISGLGMDKLKADIAKVLKGE